MAVSNLFKGAILLRDMLSLEGHFKCLSVFQAFFRLKYICFEQVPMKCFKFSQGACLIFWYHMYGNSLGNLNVYLLLNGTKILQWTKQGKLNLKKIQIYFT